MPIDPVTGGLVLGGIKALGGLFGGPSESEKIGRGQLDLQREMFRTGEKNRAGALEFSQANELAQRLLRNKLLGQAGNLNTREINTNAVFNDPQNPLSSPAGPVADFSMAPISFTDPELGANIPRGGGPRQAVPRERKPFDFFDRGGSQ